MAGGKKAKPTYFNAILGVALVLFLLGILGWLIINGRALSRAFKEDLEKHNGDAGNITDVSCDMSPAFIKGVKDNLPNAIAGGISRTSYFCH